MKNVVTFLVAVALILLLADSQQILLAQDASNQQSAASKDASDWGLLGLIGLLGLLGLKKKPPED